MRRAMGVPQPGDPGSGSSRYCYRLSPDATDVTNREAAICWDGAAGALPDQGQRGRLEKKRCVATVHHAHRRHVLNQGMIASDPASGFAYAPPRPPMHYRAAPYNDYIEPYYGASQGYAPSEKEQFLGSLFR